MWRGIPILSVITVQRFTTEERSRSFAITWDSAIRQHHCAEAADLSLFKSIGERTRPAAVAI